MATFEELATAAGRAHEAGDAKNAEILVQEAKRLYPDQFAQTMGGRPQTDYGRPDPVGLMPPALDGAEQTPTPARQNTFGDVIGPATAAPRQSLGQFAGALTGANPSPTEAALPEGMPDRLKAPIGVAGDIGGAALSTLGTVYNGLASGIAEIVGQGTTDERALARDLMIAGQVAAPELAGVSGVNRAASRAASASRALDAEPTQLQTSARAADDLGITPALGMGGKVRQMTAGGLEKFPIAGGRIESDAVRAVEEIESAFLRITEPMGAGLVPSEAGATLQGGLSRFVDRFKARSEELYGEVGRRIPANTRVEAPETLRVINETLETFSDNPEIFQRLGLGQWQTLADGLERGLSWQAAMALRSQLGQAIGKMNGPLSDMDGGRIKQAYAALTDDLSAAAQGAGPEAARAWDRANSYYRSGAQRIQRQLDRTIKADNPERAFEAFAGMLRANRSTSDVNRVRAIRSSMTREEWQEVAASIVARLGRATDAQQNTAGDAFSPQRFLTQWNGMDREARNLLLPKTVREELDKLAEVSIMARDASKERNSSNTGTAVGLGVAGFGFGVDAATTAAVIGSAALSTRAMTSPVFLRAMNRAARGDSRALRTIANGNGPFKDDAQEIITLVSAQEGSAEPQLRALP